jgi:UDP-N-acetylmuramoyl-L-alanyl-D-glutamate--2,6-diaminopimelate ligase
VVNGDDKNASKFVLTVPHSITYGIKQGQLKAGKIKLASDHSAYEARIGDETYSIRVNIPGEFNISNSLAAVAVGRELGLSKKQIETGIAALKSVEGRMTVIKGKQKFKVIVDFASTPEAFEKIYSSIRPLVKGKLIAVFGSAGRRDEKKRALQGEVAGRYADEVVLTEEDDRDEDGNRILAQIADGVKKTGKSKPLNLILDREEAIGFALTRVASANDTVLILGKGHEKTIERADGIYPWSDIEVVSAALDELVKKGKK